MDLGEGREQRGHPKQFHQRGENLQERRNVS